MIELEWGGKLYRFDSEDEARKAGFQLPKHQISDVPRADGQAGSGAVGVGPVKK